MSTHLSWIYVICGTQDEYLDHILFEYNLFNTIIQQSKKKFPTFKKNLNPNFWNMLYDFIPYFVIMA